MKKILPCLFTGLLLSASLIACGGGQPLKAAPAHLLSGSEQVIKGTSAYQKGCFKNAFEHFFQAHERYVVSNQMEGVALSLNNLGTVYRATGDSRSALAFFDKSSEIYGDLGDTAGTIQALSNKAAALIDMGNLDQAGTVLAAAFKMMPGGRPFAPLLSNRGILLMKKKDYPGAEEALKEALAAADPERLSEAATVNSALGFLMLEMKRQKEAIAYFQSALDADRITGFSKGIADDLGGIGRAHFETGNRAAAVKYWEQSVQIYALIGLPAEVRKTMADIKSAVPGTGIDIRVTELFVNRWLEGKMIEKPCEE